MDNQRNRKKQKSMFDELELKMFFSEFTISFRFYCKYNIGNIFLFTSI